MSATELVNNNSNELQSAESNASCSGIKPDGVACKIMDERRLNVFFNNFSMSKHKP
jgi:hypothetical protein